LLTVIDRAGDDAFDRVTTLLCGLPCKSSPSSSSISLGRVRRLTAGRKENSPGVSR
jgi:hypothetical protein